MPVDIENVQVVSGYPIEVCSQGGISGTNISVTSGGTVYYGSSNTVSSSSNTGSIANGSNLTVSTPTWIISATSSVVQITNYWGGGDLETLFGMWRPIFAYQQAPLAGGTSAGQLVYTGQLNTFVAVAGAATGQGMFYLDPALWTGPASGRTAKIRLRANVTTNAVAPACTNLLYGLYPVATTGGTSGNVPTVATIGTATVSTTIATPSATTQTVQTSASAAFPAAGWFCFALTVGTGGTAANANTLHGFEVQMAMTAP